MKQIKPSSNAHHWPRNAVKSVECRKKDLVIRITDWWRDKDEPAFDVECYIGDVYDYNESKVFAASSGLTKKQAKIRAILFAQDQIRKLL